MEGSRFAQQIYIGAVNNLYLHNTISYFDIPKADANLFQRNAAYFQGAKVEKRNEIRRKSTKRRNKR